MRSYVLSFSITLEMICLMAFLSGAEKAVDSITTALLFEFGTEFGGFGTELDEFGTELDRGGMLYRRLRSSRVTCQMSSQVVRSTRSLGL